MKNVHLFLMCCLVLLGATSCGHATKQAQRVASVKIDTVVTNQEKSFLQYPGRVRASEDVDLAFRVSGMIEKIYVKDGQAVRKGDLLAQMDPADYEVQLAATKAKYQQIKAEADRVIAFYKDGGATPNDYDKAVYGLKQIEALYQHHKDELAYTRLTAPFDGFIQKRFFEPHETVAAGMPVLSILGRGVPEVEINIPASEYIHRDKFNEYHCTFDIYPGKKYPLSLIGITHKANANQLYTMRLRLEIGDLPKPSAGMNTMVSVYYTNEEGDTLQVPVAALLHEAGKTGVFVYDGDTEKVRLCEVTCIRPLSDGRVIISSDEVQAGDVIVVAGVHAIKDGDVVRPLPQISNTNIGGLL